MPETKPLPKRIVLAIGLPGAGKSAWFGKKGITPLSSDRLRELLWGDPADQRLPHFVFDALRHLLRLRLLGGMRASYVDAVNLTRRDRRPFFALARNFGCAVDALWFDTPLQECLRRNRLRERRVPEQAIHRMARRFEPPTREEGFRRITRIRPPGGKRA
jgi:predicted kinase